jgi:DNA-binding transcriptional regulator YiaG
MRSVGRAARIGQVTGQRQTKAVPACRPFDLREVSVQTPVMTFAEEIREARERRGLTQAQLAKLVQVSAESISNWERGRHIPKNRAARLRAVLEMDVTHEPGTSLDPESLDTRLLSIPQLWALVDSILAEIKRRVSAGPTEAKRPDTPGTFGSAPNHVRGVDDDQGRTNSP